jgi:hypothetical protein
VTTDYPQENVESPITLTASPDRITVAYLSREGGVRRGPSIIAQYAPDGRLLGAAEVDGVIRTSVVSPDGAHLAVGVGGSGGACITSADLTVIALAGLDILDIGPSLPDTFTGDAGRSWSDVTDMIWRDGKVIATALLYYTPGEMQVCDPDPQLWTRTVDPITLDVIDADRPVADAVRWVGPDCADMVTVNSRTDGEEWPETEYELVARIGGATTALGSYNRLTLGAVAGAQCP